MAASRRQRAIQIIIGISIVLIISIGITLFLRRGPQPVALTGPTGQDSIVKTPKDRGKVKYRLLHEQMDNAVTSEAIKVLSLHNIAFEVQKSGRAFNLSVDRDYYESAKNLLALKGIPARGASGFELLDVDQGFGVTEYDKRIRFNRALSGEMAKMISQFYDVQDSQVRVVVPEKSSWGSEASPVTASVLVRGVDGRIVSDETVFSIMKLLQNAVSELALENISVVDINSQVLSIGVQERLAVAQVRSDDLADASTAKLELEPELERETLSAFKARLIDDRLAQMKAVLAGVLPTNSYNSTLDLELNPDYTVDRMTISVVVDSAHIPILDQPLKKQIFRVISGATGYNRDRGDVIKLDLAQLNLKSPDLAISDETSNDDSTDDSGSPWLGYTALVIVGLLGALIYRYRRRQDRIAAHEMAKPDVPDYSVKLQQLATQNPVALGKVIMKWIDQDTQVSTRE